MLFRRVLASTVLLSTGIQAQVENKIISGWSVVKRQSPEGMVTVHTVQVGNAEGTQRFYPDSLKVEPGSMVQFQFHPKNHSVSQSTWEQPCSPIGASNGSHPAIRSGFLPVLPDAAQMPVFTVMVHDSNPIWLFCGQTNHCQNGMVMVINPPEGADKGIEAFRSAAMSGGSGGGSQGGIPILPPGGFGNGGVALPTGGAVPSTAAGTPTPTQTRPLSATTNAAPKQMSHAASLSGVLIAAFAIFGL
ncbi:uncharacterized protein PADG_06613 [Paracoccidioides brasiliensis Pb18]|uniref:Phytocyanin domain-containing protein n=2 Tax=Paracoccidioides brasiliensis TaxID=121759 RepID=C1GH77_PARBD|nr:uncharacterized protein PADG_06613 [Paracoccidioides brasiliensis Pb18]EEH50534.1 hypothetical protein PADG_06613 [Paracoccidioides brasiliensis Pb18]ODH29721.1 hypothetical protein ACO22_03691 [Paracoccidioides brasiliensis]